jgi:polysaccharide pyruvyl transferase CsaB
VAGPAASTDRPVAVISGWAGSTNLGDELLGLALVRKVRACGVDPLVVSIDPDLTRTRFAVDAIDHRRWPAIVGAIGRADALITGGGSIIHDVTSKLNLPYHLARPRLAAALRTPFSAVGLGIGPLTTGAARWMTRRVLGRARTVGVRDEASADLLRELGVERVAVGADLALALPIPQVPVTPDRMVVSLRPPIPGGLLPVASRANRADEEWVEAMAAALDRAAELTGLAVRFVPMQTDRDDAVHRQVAARMRSPVTHAGPTLGTILDELAACRVVVSMRYHGAIGALMGARPAVLLEYTPKVGALAAEVGEGFGVLGCEAGDLAAVPETVEAVLGRGGTVAEARGRLRDRERVNDRIIHELLEAG